MSKVRQAAWMRAYRASKKATGTVLLPKALVRRLAAQGIRVEKSLRAVPVSLDDYRAQGRVLEAKKARIEWQSSGIRMLQEKVAVLEGTVAMMRVMGDTESKQRITRLEADLARLEAMMGSTMAATSYDEEERGNNDERSRDGNHFCL